MYDTAPTAFQRTQERNVDAWMRAAAYAAGTEPDVDWLPPEDLVLEHDHLGHAVESKKRDNLELGQALVSIGLMGTVELAEVQSAQAQCADLVGSLLVASAIRSRLGEILLKAKHITSCQLEFALEMQRLEGGRLGEILVGLGWLDQQTLDAALVAQAARQVA